MRDAIDRVLARQDSNGSFGLWSVGGDGRSGSTPTSTDFLTRARERGFAVPQLAFNLALDRLRNYVANTTEVEQGNGDDLAYAVYVLARNGRPVMGDLRYLADTKLEAFGTPLARAQLARRAGAARRPRPRADGVRLGASSSCGRDRDDGGVSRPITARGCATAPACWRSPPRPATCARAIQRDRARSSRRSAAIDRTPARRRTPGWCSPPRRSPRDAEAIALTVDGVAAKGALYRTFRDGGARARRPVTLANAGAATGAGRRHRHRQPDRAGAGGVAAATRSSAAYYKLDGTQGRPGAGAPERPARRRR